MPAGQDGDRGIQQRREFRLVLVVRHQAGDQRIAGAGGMEIDFADAGRQVVEQAGNAIAGHVAGPGDAEGVIVDGEAGASRLAAQDTGPGVEDFRSWAGGGAACGEGPWRLGGDADGAQAVAAADIDRQAADRGMQVHVFVGVGVIECQAGGGEGGELGLDFQSELAAYAEGGRKK